MALTTHGTHQTKALPTANDVKNYSESTGKNRTQLRWRPLFCTYLLIASIVVWLIFAFGSRASAVAKVGLAKLFLHYERTCVDMSRHNA